MSERYMPSLPSTLSVEVKYSLGWLVRIMFLQRGRPKAFLRLGYFMTTPEKMVSTPIFLEERWKTFGPSLLSVLSMSRLAGTVPVPLAAAWFLSEGLLEA